MAITFKTTILKADGLNATGISVPPDVIAELGTSKRPKVKITLNNHTYRSTVAPYGDVFMLPLSQEHRAAAGVEAGDELLVTIELDTEPRTVDVPDDLALALDNAGALAKFDALSYTNRKEYVRQVESAKAQETRERRILGIVAKLTN
jgi:hypothetical protein